MVLSERDLAYFVSLSKLAVGTHTNNKTTMFSTSSWIEVNLPNTIRSSRLVMTSALVLAKPVYISERELTSFSLSPKFDLDSSFK